MGRVTQAELLNKVYTTIYSEEFHAESMDSRVMLQKAVFLMRELGVSCGNYEFTWDQYGPFSPELSDDMKQPINNENLNIISFNKIASGIMDKLKEIFSIETEYSKRYWVEAIASLFYLKHYMYPIYDESQIIRELENKKVCLGNHRENEKAMQALNSLFE